MIAAKEFWNIGPRSDVFNVSLSQTGFVEGQTRRIEIKDIDIDVLRQLIKFIYTDKFEIEDTNLSALFTAADRFNVPMLRAKCLK